MQNINFKIEDLNRKILIMNTNVNGIKDQAFNFDMISKEFKDYIISIDK